MALLVAPAVASLVLEDVEDDVALATLPSPSSLHESFLSWPGGQSAKDVVVDRVSKSISSVISPLLLNVVI